MTLSGPAGLFQERLAGRYFLARCGAVSEWERTHDWNIYLRRPLFMVGRRPLLDSSTERWQVWAPNEPDPGYIWLRELPEGAALNLTGPFGNGFEILPTTRNLLLLADQRRAPLLLPLIDRMLDRGGRITIILLGEAGTESEFTTGLPFAAEVRRAADDGEWQATLADTLPWADQLCGAIRPDHLPGLADAIRKHRVRLEAGFGLMLVEADLACGAGACLACVVPLANGSLTRACVHGPVFDLLDLAGRT